MTTLHCRPRRSASARRLLVGGLTLCWLLGAADAAPPAANPIPAEREGLPVAERSGDAVAGRRKSDDERCQECHGRDGNAADNEDGIGNVGKLPKLAGQSAEYIVKQIRDFRAGTRQNETMSIMASSVADADVADIAAYFAGQRRSPGDGGVAVSPVGRRLFAEGDSARGILACAACHGAKGEGRVGDGLVAPAIASQYKRYLQKHLHEWRVAERANSAGGVMNGIARLLSDDDIDALADYLSGL